METRKWNRLTDNQVRAAKKFNAKYSSISVSQCGKWLDWLFAYERGEITKEDFESQTGHQLKSF
jgi:hypothetical protein